MNRTYLLFVVAGLLALPSCVVTDVGNPQDSESADADVQFVAVESEQLGGLTLEDNVDVDSARFNVLEITFRDGDGCSPGESQLSESWYVELLKPPTARTLRDLPTSSCGVELELGPDETTPYTYAFDFSTPNGTVSVVDDKPITIRLDGESNFVVEPDGSFFFALYSDEWFIDLSLPDNAQGMVNDAAFEARFRNNFARSMRLIPEVDRDGSLSTDELSGVVAETAEIDGVDVADLP